MTQLMERTIQRLSDLPEEKQDGIVAIILEEVLKVEEKWDEIFATQESQDLLARMGQKAIEEFERGETMPLDDFLNDA